MEKLDMVKLRAELMPIENKYSIDNVKTALLNYVEKTGRRITVEYIFFNIIYCLFNR